MLNSDDLINKVKSYNKFLNPETLGKAYNFAINAHEHQKRPIPLTLGNAECRRQGQIGGQ